MAKTDINFTEIETKDVPKIFEVKINENKMGMIAVLPLDEKTQPEYTFIYTFPQGKTGVQFTQDSLTVIALFLKQLNDDLKQKRNG